MGSSLEFPDQHSVGVRKMYQLDVNNFTMIFSHKWPLLLTDKQCTRLHTNSAGPQPQHLWHNTTCGSETTYILELLKMDM